MLHKIYDKGHDIEYDKFNIERVQIRHWSINVDAPKSYILNDAIDIDIPMSMKNGMSYLVNNPDESWNNSGLSSALDGRLHDVPGILKAG